MARDDPHRSEELRAGILTTYRLHGHWPDGQELADAFEVEAEALDAAQMCERAGATGVSVDRVTRHVQPDAPGSVNHPWFGRVDFDRAAIEQVSVETIYGADNDG